MALHWIGVSVVDADFRSGSSTESLRTDTLDQDIDIVAGYVTSRAECDGWRTGRTAWVLSNSEEWNCLGGNE
jgi:hypothetical protein